MKTLKTALKTHCELHWWNMGKKTLSFKGELKELLKNYGITYSKRKTENEGIYKFYFKSKYNISFRASGTISDFTHLAKQAIQMEIVRMGDKSQLYVAGCWRSTVTVNF